MDPVTRLENGLYVRLRPSKVVEEALNNPVSELIYLEGLDLNKLAKLIELDGITGTGFSEINPNSRELQERIAKLKGFYESPDPNSRYPQMPFNFEEDLSEKQQEIVTGIIEQLDKASYDLFTKQTNTEPEEPVNPILNASNDWVSTQDTSSSTVIEPEKTNPIAMETEQILAGIDGLSEEQKEEILRKLDFGDVYFNRFMKWVAKHIPELENLSYEEILDRFEKKHPELVTYNRPTGLSVSDEAQGQIDAISDQAKQDLIAGLSGEDKKDVDKVFDDMIGETGERYRKSPPVAFFVDKNTGELLRDENGDVIYSHRYHLADQDYLTSSKFNDEREEEVKKAIGDAQKADPDLKVEVFTMTRGTSRPRNQNRLDFDTEMYELKPSSRFAKSFELDNFFGDNESLRLIFENKDLQFIAGEDESVKLSDEAYSQLSEVHYNKRY